MKKIGLIAALLLVVTSVPVFAQNKTNNLDIAYEVSMYKYKEPGLMSLKSKPKQGVSLVYTRRSAMSDQFNERDKSFAMLEFRYMNGDADYNGGIQYGDGHTEPLKLDNLTDYYFELGARLGSVYSLTDRLEFWPYVGLGWRQLRNHLEEGGDSGYLRQSTYLYAPIGFFGKYNGPDGWTLSLNGEFDYLIKGRQYSGDSAYYKDTTHHQSDGYGVRAGFRIAKEFNSMGVFVEPFWRYWHIQNSDIEISWRKDIPYGVSSLEPKNHTHEYGLKAGISF